MDEPEPTGIRYERTFRLKVTPEILARMEGKPGALREFMREAAERALQQHQRAMARWYGAEGSVATALAPRGEDLTAEKILALTAELEETTRDTPAALLVSSIPLAAALRIRPDVGTVQLEMYLGDGLSQEVRTLLDRYGRPVLVIDERAWKALQGLVHVRGSPSVGAYLGMPVHRIGHGDYLPKEEDSCSDSP